MRLKNRLHLYLWGLKFLYKVRCAEIITRGLVIDQATLISAAEDVVISISGFDQSESHGLKRLFRALGKLQNHLRPLHRLNLFSQV